MMARVSRRRLGAAVCGLAVLATGVAGLAEDEEDLSQYYGFEPLEIFKLEWRSANLLTGDFDHDGRADVLLADNSHSRIDLLAQRAEKPEGKDAGGEEAEVNSIKNDWRFDHRKIAVEREISSMAVGDFNGDGRTDVAYFGAPDRLVVRYQPEEGDWTERTTFRLPEVQTVQWNMAAGDLNADGRTDLVVLGQNVTYVLRQQEDGTPATPERLMNTSERLGLAQVADLDGDGRADLCYVANDEQSRSLCARLQTDQGSLGPELRFEVEQLRSLTLAEVDGEPGAEVLAVDSSTGRVRMLRLARPEAKPGELAGQLVQYGFGPAASGRDRDLATGDVDGDGLNDVVVTDPAAAQVVVFRQRKGQGLDSGTPYPSMVGATQARVGDLDGEKGAEVVVLSGKEKALGLSRMEGQRLTFPTPLPVEGEPAAVELADLDKDGATEIVYISRDREGRNSKYAFRALTRDGTAWKPLSFGEEGTGAALELRGTPDRLVRLDADKDGRPEFLVFFGLDRAPQVLSLGEDGVPKAVEAEGGMRLGEVPSGAVFLGGGAQPVVLVAQENFARNLQLDEQGRWVVRDQYNASESSARIAGAALVNLDGEPGNEVVLVDAGIRKLRVLRMQDGLYRPWKEVETGSLDYKSTHVADLNGDGYDDLLLFGSGRFAVLYAGQTDPVLKEVASYETKLEKVFFTDVTAGDLNGDGRPDLAVIDTRSHYVEILHYDAKRGLRHALHFRLFEEKSFSDDDEGGGSEPREVAIADVTGDGRADLLLLSHDRLLLYPQDDGR